MLRHIIFCLLVIVVNNNYLFASNEKLNVEVPEQNKTSVVGRYMTCLAKGLNNNVVWAIMQHTHFHIGKRETFKDEFTNFDCEIFWGVSNGISFYTRKLNKHCFWGLGFIQVNFLFILYTILRGYEIFKETDCENLVGNSLFILLSNCHLFYLKIWSFLDVKLIGLGGLLFFAVSLFCSELNFKSKKLDFVLHDIYATNIIYLLFYPVIQIDITKCIKFFNS